MEERDKLASLRFRVREGRPLPDSPESLEKELLTLRAEMRELIHKYQEVRKTLALSASKIDYLSNVNKALQQELAAWKKDRQA